MGGLSTLAVAVSSAAAGELGQLEQPIIYGADDRREVYEVESPILRARARRATAALISPLALRYAADGGVALEPGYTLEQAKNLCPDQAFADQPVLAWCSGVLIDDDLVATAGHCLGESSAVAREQCAHSAVVFGYLYEQEGRLAELTLDDAYRCRRVVAWRWGPSLAVPDVAIIQLDRPVATSLAPAPLARRKAEASEPIHVVGFGSGLPAKVSSGAQVLTADDSEYFTAETDTFAGDSGGPVFNSAGELLGVHRGGQHDWDEGRPCTSARIAEDGAEVHQHALSVRAALCDSGWPSERLCGTPATCGDGICSPFEPCAADCPRARCGDGICEGSEEPLTCDADCAPPVMPSEWSCDPRHFADRRGCDCNCGAPDPDCVDPREPVFNCERGFVCTPAGACVRDRSRAGMDVSPASMTWETSVNAPSSLERDVDSGCRMAVHRVRRAPFESWGLLCFVAMCLTRRASKERPRRARDAYL